MKQMPETYGETIMREDKNHLSTPRSNPNYGIRPWVQVGEAIPEEWKGVSFVPCPSPTPGVCFAAARIAELEAALRPFAELPPVIIDVDGDGTLEAVHYWCVVGHPGKSIFTREDLLRAREAMGVNQNG